MKWLYGLIGLFFLIIFHEFGHFIAAKLCGVKVESFSVGFGPVLLHKTIHGTDYRLSLFPLGGYCGMKGEKDFQKAIENNLKAIEAEKDSLYGVHPLKRAFIGFAGPFFNYIFAVIAFSVIAGIGYTYYTYSNKIILGTEISENSCTAAKDAGILTGDVITALDDKEITDFSDLLTYVSTNPDRDMTVTLLRGDEQLQFTVHTQLDKESGTGKIGLAADTSNILEKHTPEYSFFGAIKKGFSDCSTYIGMTFKSIGILFKGVNLKSTVSGPARVTDMLGSSIKEGFAAGLKTGIVSTLSLMGLISISLFIMNLLPVPVLDGGLILIALIEFILRRKINPKIQYYVQFIGLAFIAVLFIIGLTGDISYFFGKK